MWVSKSEMRRLLAQLSAAESRAIESENRLTAERERLDGLVASERQSKDWLTVQLASRVVTKHGQYGLDHEIPVKEVPQANPKGFIREPNEYDLAVLKQYQQWAREAGQSEEDAREKWEAEMRGESVNYESETM